MPRYMPSAIRRMSESVDVRFSSLNIYNQSPRGTHGDSCTHARADGDVRRRTQGCGSQDAHAQAPSPTSPLPPHARPPTPSSHHPCFASYSGTRAACHPLPRSLPSAPPPDPARRVRPRPHVNSPAGSTQGWMQGRAMTAVCRPTPSLVPLAPRCRPPIPTY